MFQILKIRERELFALVMARMENAGRRLQDWTNKNVFIKSFESADVALASYQEGGPPALDGEVDEAHHENDPHGASSTPITALQAAWNVTNAIQGMFIVGLPFAVKVLIYFFDYLENKKEFVGWRLGYGICTSVCRICLLSNWIVSY